AQVFDVSGVAVGGTIWVASTTKNETSPSAGMDYYGNFAVAFTYAYSSTDLDIYARQFNASGAYQRTLYVATSGHNEYSPSVDMTYDGRFVVAYSSDYSDPYSSSTSIFGAEFSASGAKIADGIEIAYAVDSYNWQPTVAMNSSGEYAIVYSYYAEGYPP